MKKERSVRKETAGPGKLVLLIVCFACLLGAEVRAEEPSPPSAKETVRDPDTAVDTMTKTLRLPAGQVTRIPRYEDAGEILYVLDESSIHIRVTGTKEAEGADVYTLTKTLTDLPDNDLERIPMTVSHQGNTCDLLYVIYTVTSWDAYELPETYEAVCCYGWLEKYWVSYDSEWEATLTYLGYPIGGRLTSTLAEYFYDYEELREHVLSKPQEPGKLRKIGGERVPGKKELYREEIREEEIPLGTPGHLKAPAIAAVAAAAAGTFLFLPVFFCFLTVPLYEALHTGGYRWLGQVRIRRGEDCYEALLTEALVRKAKTSHFMIRISGYLQKHSPGGVLEIRCPSGIVITRRLKREVLFRLSSEE